MKLVRYMQTPLLFCCFRLSILVTSGNTGKEEQTKNKRSKMQRLHTMGLDVDREGCTSAVNDEER
jgi:hypothetical protein